MPHDFLNRFNGVGSVGVARFKGDLPRDRGSPNRSR